jgi:hypothetical protein
MHSLRIKGERIETDQGFSQMPFNAQRGGWDSEEGDGKPMSGFPDWTL